MREKKTRQVAGGPGATVQSKVWFQAKLRGERKDIRVGGRKRRAGEREAEKAHHLKNLNPFGKKIRKGEARGKDRREVRENKTEEGKKCGPTNRRNRVVPEWGNSLKKKFHGKISRKRRGRGRREKKGAMKVEGEKETLGYYPSKLRDYLLGIDRRSALKTEKERSYSSF